MLRQHSLRIIFDTLVSRKTGRGLRNSGIEELRNSGIQGLEVGKMFHIRYAVEGEDELKPKPIKFAPHNRERVTRTSQPATLKPLSPEP